MEREMLTDSLSSVFAEQEMLKRLVDLCGRLVESDRQFLATMADLVTTDDQQARQQHGAYAELVAECQSVFEDLDRWVEGSGLFDRLGSIEARLSGLGAR